MASATIMGTIFAGQKASSAESDRIFNSSGQNGRHFADDVFRCIFVIEKNMYFY